MDGRSDIVAIRPAMEMSKYQRKDNTDFYDLTEDSQPSPDKKEFGKQLDSLLSAKWNEIKEKRKHARHSSSRSDTSENEDRVHHSQHKEKRKSKSSSSKHYRSRSRSPFSRHTKYEYYRKRVEKRDSVERYRRSRSHERRTYSRRSRSHERDSKHSILSKKTYKRSKDQIIKTEHFERYSEEENENDSQFEPQRRISSSVFDKLRKKILLTLQSSSNRNTNVTNTVVDSTRELNVHEWKDEFDIELGPSSESLNGQINAVETEIQRDNTADNQRIRSESNNLAPDVHRKKIKFTFTKSMKTDTSQISSVFNEPTSDSLTDARTKLGALLRSTLNDRRDKERPNEAVREAAPVQEHSTIDDDSIDYEIIKKIISQTQVRTSSYELSVDVPAGFNSDDAVEMLENELSSSTLINSSAHRSAQPFTGASVVNTTTTQVVRSNYCLPIPSTKFLPDVRKSALSQHHVNPSMQNPFNDASDRSDQVSETAMTYGDLKNNRIASGDSLSNYKIPKKAAQINRSTVQPTTSSQWHDSSQWNDSLQWDENSNNRPNKNSTGDNVAPQPATNSPKPATNPPKPATNPPKPATNPPKPATNPPKPTTNPPKPATNPPKPVTNPPKPATNTPTKNNARKELLNYKIPKKTTTANGSTSAVSKTPVAEVKKVTQNDKFKRPTTYVSEPPSFARSQARQTRESMHAAEYDNNPSPPMSISSDSSADESYSNAPEGPIESDNENWDNSERPTSPQSNVDTNAQVQPDRSPTENETASDPASGVSQDQIAMESLKNWMQSNEFATLVDLMQQLAQHKNLDKLKEALADGNEATGNVELGEGSSTATSANAAANTSIGINGDQKSNITKFKNIDKEWHSLRKVLQCQECDKPVGNSLVSHYVNLHPNCEVLTSRLAPEAAENLRSGVYDSNVVVSKPENMTSYHYKQFCYFCNVFRCYNKLFWVDHMARHTGYYRLKCNHCSRKFACRPPNSKCFRINNVEAIPQPQFKKRELMAYVCDLCNFVRFHQHEIEMHLSREHGHGVDSTQFKELKFLSFPNIPGKWTRKNPCKKYKKRKPKPVDEFLSNLGETDDEIDLKDEKESEYETETDESESDIGSDWSNMDVLDEEMTFTESSSESDFV